MHGRDVSSKPSFCILTQTERPLQRGRFIPALFIAAEVIIVNILFWLTISLYPVIKTGGYDLRVLWLLVEMGCLPLVFLNLGRRHELRTIYLEKVMRASLIDVGMHALCFMSLAGFLGLALPYKTYLFYYGTMVVCLPVSIITASYLLKSYRRRGYNFTNVVIVGTGSTAVRLADSMKKDAGFGYTISAFFDEVDTPGKMEGCQVLPMSELRNFVVRDDVRQVYFTLSGQDPSLPDVIKTCDDNLAEFFYVPQIPKTLSRGFQLHNIGAIPVLAIRSNPLKSIVNRGLKRAFDIAVSSLFLCFYPLIYIPVAVSIKLSSPGPVYFKQERTGYRGRSFKCFKFRTMRVNASANDTQATKDDPRKTRVGDFLRRTSIDELPQFINVWRGDMSIVGPRPHMLAHTRAYSQIIDSYMVRHAIKPGITGWAQVNGYRGLTDQLWKMERRVEHDVWYIENWTFLLDLKIIVRTIINAFSEDKNAF